jgi:hypothetical protein
MLAFSVHWFDWWRRAAAIGWGHLDRMAALNDPRQLRNWWLADFREVTAEAMKSPVFLAMMRFNLTLLTQPTMIKAAQMFALPSR